MRFIDSNDISNVLHYTGLMDRLQGAFARSEVKFPMRHHHDYANPDKERESTLLLMPAWLEGQYLGVKMVTVSPYNSERDLPAIQGLYILNNAITGQTELILDAKELTVRRTAATSALASKFLSREDSSSLLMVGTGALAPHLIEAHATARPVKKVYIWGRNYEKASQICQLKQLSHLSCEPIPSVEEVMADVDIISCATLSKTPLISGKWLQEGQHIDLVGSYRPDMREADDDVMTGCDLFVDTYAGALKETGDLVIPIANGLISRDDIRGELKDLCNGQHKGRTKATQITCFKSVGHAMEDLVAAILVKENIDG